MPYDSIGNKANPVLAGLTGLGEGLFQGFLTRKKMDEETRQFNEELAFKERQYSLLQDINRREAELRQANTLADNQRQDFNSMINVAEKYDIRDARKYFPYESGTQALPQDAINLSGNSLLGGKFGIPKSQDKLMTENQRISRDLEKRRLDLEERDLKIKEQGGGIGDFTLSPGQTKYVDGKPFASKPLTDKSIDWEAQAEASQSLIDVIDEKLNGLSDNDKLMNSSLVVELEKEKMKELGKLKLSQAKINALKNRGAKRGQGNKVTVEEYAKKWGITVEEAKKFIQ